MTALQHQPDGPELVPYTAAEYEALGEDDDRLRIRCELQEGSVVMSPSPRFRHNRASRDLHYWIVDLDPPISLVACHLTKEFGYQDSGVVTGEFRATDPFDVRIDLTKLG